MQYHVGDRIYCRVSDDGTTVFDVDYDDFRYSRFRSEDFLVLAIDRSQYIVLVPITVTSHIGLLDDETLSNYRIDSRYRGNKVVSVREKSVGGRKIVDFYREAIRCKMCNTPHPYAVPNFPNDILICYICRTDPRLLYQIQTVLNDRE